MDCLYKQSYKILTKLIILLLNAVHKYNILTFPYFYGNLPPTLTNWSATMGAHEISGDSKHSVSIEIDKILFYEG